MAFLTGIWSFLTRGGWKYLLGAIVLGFALKFGYEAYNNYTEMAEQVEILTEEKVRLETVNNANEAALEEIERQRERQAQLLRELEDGLLGAEEYANELQRILSDSNLTKLALERPGLIERRINDGTNDVFRALECDTGGLCPTETD